MVELYNHRLPEDSKLPWRLSGMSKGIGKNDYEREQRAEG
jgi:hypothetical protein